jgi:hypothetical protein
MKDNALYLEGDEDITSAIDKLKKSIGSSVQIVVPKRSTLLQSVINQKLLKKAAKDAGKQLVLVTNDRVAIDLAARVGLAIAPSLGAEAMLAAPRITAPIRNDDIIVDDGTDEPEPPVVSRSTTSIRKTAPVMATKELDDEANAPLEDVSAVPTGDKVAKSPKVPNFSKLQKRLLWVFILAVLVVGYFVGMHYFTTGKVVIYANGAKADINAPIIVDSALTTSNFAANTLAGVIVSVSHNLSTTFTPTGKKNIGTKASGSVTVSNNSGAAQPLSAGTRFTAPDGNVFRSTQDSSVPAATASVAANGQVNKQPGTATVAVAADQPGDTYNEAAGQKYGIPGLPADQQLLITAVGSQMTGGTSKTVNVVTQADVDKARDAAVTADKASGLKDLKAKVAAAQMPLDSSLNSIPVNVVSNPGVDGEGDQSTLTLTLNYSLTAVSTADYTALLQGQETKLLGINNQIYDNGLAKATVTAGAAVGTKQPFTVATIASGGPKIDKTALVQKMKGKRYSEATDLASSLPGVVRADVSLSPAWATNLPQIAKNISITIKINQE